MNDKQAKGLQQFCNQYFANDIERKPKKGFISEKKCIEYIKRDKSITEEQRKLLLERTEKKDEKSKKMLEEAGFE